LPGRRPALSGRSLIHGLSWVLFNRSVYGRTLSAVRQIIRAASLAGFRVAWVTASAFVASATQASETGLTLGA
jgi:ribose transport system permease protein